MEEAKKHFPFPIDKGQLSYEVLEFFFPDHIGQLKVVAWAVPEIVITSINKAMHFAELHLTEAQFEAFSIRNALEIILRDNHKQNNVAVISMGASCSSVHIVRNSQVWQSKNFFPGGAEFTKAISERINVNKKQAENLKITKANMDISKASHIDYVLFKTIEPLATNVLDELINSLDEYESMYEVNIPIAILLNGGTALLKNIDKFIERGVYLKTQLFQLPVSKKINLHAELIEELGASFMVALGLAITPFLKGVDPIELNGETLTDISSKEEELQQQQEDELTAIKKEKKGFWSWFK